MGKIRKMRRIITVFCAVLLTGVLFFSVPRARAASLCYVNVNSPGPTHDGTSWTNAYISLQSALSGCSQVWVAAGVYKPGANRTATFNIPPGVAVYGGFAGRESSLSQRNPVANITILSGDIDNNDINTDGNNIDETPADIRGSNSYHVVTMIGTSTPVTSSTVLDGFTITGGQANGTSPNDSGGGLYCHGEGGGHNCSPTLANLHFSGNYALVFGGAVFNNGYMGTSNPTFTNVTFSGNSSGAFGGAVFNGGYPGVSSPTFTNVTFSGNYAVQNGGAVYNYGKQGNSNPSFTDVTFYGNAASLYGGAVYSDGDSGHSSASLTRVTFDSNHANLDGGGIYNFGENSGVSSPTLVNVTFYNNSADGYGGGMYNDAENSGTSTATLTNVTFTLNHAGKSGQPGGYGGAIIDDGYNGGTSSSTLTNVILWGDTASVSGPEIWNSFASSGIDYSVVQGGCASISGASCGGHNLSSNPQLSALGNYGGPTQTVALLSGSSAIDTGTNSGCPSTDQRGYPRPVDGNGDGTAICDIGAFEYQPSNVNVSGNVGVAGATLTYTGGSTTADSSGNYTITVPYGWSGTVTPSLSCYTFSPTPMNYTNVASNQTNQNYIARSE